MVSLAEVFHPWVHWEGPGSGFESLSVAAVVVAAGVRKSGISPLGIKVEKQGFGTACEIRGQRVQGVGLKAKAFILTFRDLASHLWQGVLVKTIWSVRVFPRPGLFSKLMSFGEL